MRKYQKLIILGLVLTLVVFGTVACGVPDEEEFEELEEEAPADDDFGMENEISEELVAYNLQIYAYS
ncbi:MAG: hypothetical protein ACQEQG_02020 [Bacillota bacterium]